MDEQMAGSRDETQWAGDKAWMARSRARPDDLPVRYRYHSSRDVSLLSIVDSSLES
jgi:hypothetical protein